VLQEFSGAQLAAGANFAGGEGRGAQLAGGVNVAQAWRGAQLAGGVNVAARAHGLQGSPINIAGEASGLQLGVINTAGGASGLQLGVINVSRRGSGLKLGVINVAAEHDGETFGIINIIGNGLHNVAVYATDAMLSNVALKLGSRRLYTSFIAAYHPGDALTGPGPERYSYGNQRYGFGLGLGYRVPLERGRLTFVDIEASSMGIHRDITSWNEVPMLASARAVLGIRIAGPLTALVGLSGNVAVAWGNRDLDLAPDSLSIVGRSDSTTTRISPGLLLGLQI
jgi:hypothetical protein